MKRKSKKKLACNLSYILLEILKEHGGPPFGTQGGTKIYFTLNHSQPSYCLVGYFSLCVC